MKARSKSKELETKSKEKDQTAKRLVEAELELERLNTSLAHHKKKAKEDAERLHEAEEKRAKEVANISRLRDEDNRRMRVLQSSLESLKKRQSQKSNEGKKKKGVAMDNSLDAGEPDAALESIIISNEDSNEESAPFLSNHEDDHQRLIMERENLVSEVERLKDTRNSLQEKVERSNTVDEMDDVDFDILDQELGKDEDAKQILEVLKESTLSEARRLVVGCLRELIENRSGKIAPHQVQEMEREISYFKSTNKDLKSKLREVMALNLKLSRKICSSSSSYRAFCGVNIQRSEVKLRSMISSANCQPSKKKFPTRLVFPSIK